MFDNLSGKLNRVIKNLSGHGRLTDDNIKDTLREIRVALLEADVALPVITGFLDDIREQVIGTRVKDSLNPGQAMIQIVQDELIKVLGSDTAELNLQCPAPAVILMAGLQGSGKTTTSGKLAKWLQETQKKSVMVASCDVYRPAAIEQLKTVADSIGVDCFPSDPTATPVAIAEAALEASKRSFKDILIIDTAGRLHVDEAMMAEIKALHAALNPIETLFVIDSMTGQDAANTAKAFGDALPLTGTVLTKLDGDARGGAALSVRQITGTPIKFIGIGEKLDGLEAFHPDRIASRILGMGDMLSLIEEIEQKVDKKKADKLARKIKKGRGFDLTDFRDQLQQMEQMGGLSSMIEKIPGMGNLPTDKMAQMGGKSMSKLIAIINSMTPKERSFPDVMKGSHKRRIAGGSGTTIQDINQLLSQFKRMQKMMKKMSRKGGMNKMMQGLQAMQGGGGGLPPGSFPPS